MGKRLSFTTPEGKEKSVPQSHLMRMMKLNQVQRENEGLKADIGGMREEINAITEATLELKAHYDGLQNLLLTLVEFHHAGRVVLPESILESNSKIGGQVVCDIKNGQVIITKAEPEAVTTAEEAAEKLESATQPPETIQ